MKKLIVVVLAILIILSFYGCSPSIYDSGKNVDKESRFVSLGITYKISKGSYEIIKDNQTGIIYISSISGFDTTPLLKVDGTPYNYDDFMIEYIYVQSK